MGEEGEEGRKSRRKAEEEEGEMRSQERSILSSCTLSFRRTTFGCEELLPGQPLWFLHQGPLSDFTFCAMQTK